MEPDLSNDDAYVAMLVGRRLPDSALLRLATLFPGTVLRYALRPLLLEVVRCAARARPALALDISRRHGMRMPPDLLDECEILVALEALAR